MHIVGKLPHRPFRHIPMHIIYRLKGRVPISVLKQIDTDYDDQSKALLRRTDLADAKKAIYQQLLETALHQKSNGPYHLSDSRTARIVIESWRWLVEQRNIRVYAACVMSNHVHVLASSRDGTDVEPGSIMKAHKNHTARSCNRVLGTSGKSFWEAGYFDRDVRPGKFSTVMWYILNNPVAAGLVNRWEEWPHTYLNSDYDLLFRDVSDTTDRDPPVAVGGS